MTDPTLFRIQPEPMPNGELRVRLISPDGNNYIRTEAGASGAWQKAHHHQHLRETYVVERGWMGYAVERDGQPLLAVYWPNEVVTTQPLVPHNVYLPANAVIHTIKHGSADAKDWNENPNLTVACLALSEKDIQRLSHSLPTSEARADRFDAYVELYNNLDRLLWGIPSFLAVAATVLIGFTGNLLSRQQTVDIPPVALSLVFILIGALFGIGAYSISRLRRHHTLAGNKLANMERDGYFADRHVIAASSWPPSAPSVIRWLYVGLATLAFAAALTALVKYELLVKLIQWKP